MPILPLYGHEPLKQRLQLAVERGTLPASLLIHGPPGIGKQRIALWLGQLLLCQAEAKRPCGLCTSCRYAADLVHPDLRWFFPRPRLDAGAGREDVLEDHAEAMTERLASGGVYQRPSGSEGIFVATVRAIVQLAAYTPSLASRKVFVVGEAERMVSQEGADQAANAFLKLLEEPPSDTTIIITSSEPGALLPTIRSRVVSLRATPLSDEEMRVFASDAHAAKALGGGATAERLKAAGGAPGALIGAKARTDADSAAAAFLDAALSARRERVHAILALGSARARGFFSDMLDSLTMLLHERARTAAARGVDRDARASAHAVDVVEEAKERAAGNVNPQLIGAAMAKELSALLR